MDVQMPNMDGVEATRHIKQILVGVGVLSFSVFTDCLEASIAAGADGHLMKDCGIQELLAELKCVAAISIAGRKLSEESLTAGGVELLRQPVASEVVST